MASVLSSYYRKLPGNLNVKKEIKLFFSGITLSNSRIVEIKKE